MYAKYKWAGMTSSELAQKRVTAARDSWILFMKNKITQEEYISLITMISSKDIENLILAIELIKTKNRKIK